MRPRQRDTERSNDCAWSCGQIVTRNPRPHKASSHTSPKRKRGIPMTTTGLLMQLFQRANRARPIATCSAIQADRSPAGGGRALHIADFIVADECNLPRIDIKSLLNTAKEPQVGLRKTNV